MTRTLAIRQLDRFISETLSTAAAILVYATDHEQSPAAKVEQMQLWSSLCQSAVDLTIQRQKLYSELMPGDERP